MLSILVCHSYFLRFDQKQQERAKPYPPLATLQVASMLRKAGHEVSLFDAMLAEDLERFERQLDVLKPQLVLLYEDNYNFLSKMCLGRMRRAACEMLRLARTARRTAHRRGLRCLRRTGQISRGRRRCRAARRSARDADGAGRPARSPDRRRAMHSWSRACPMSAYSARTACSATPAARRCRSRPPRRCPPGTWSTSKNIAASGGARTATSASTWPRRAAARSAATGARNPSGAINTCSDRRARWPRK